MSNTVAHEPADSTAPTEPPPPLPSPPEARSSAAGGTPNPDTCICQEWAGVSAGRHHALCQFRSQWDREHSVPVAQLVELETAVVAREANAEEAAASEQKEPEDGVGAIELGDGKLYYARAE